MLVSVLKDIVPESVAARKAIGDFQSMIRSKSATKLDNWVESARGSLINWFAKGIAKDLAAVRNAIILPWSNAQTEAQITRLNSSRGRCMAARNSI